MMLSKIAVLAIALLVISAGMYLLEALFPAISAKPIWRRDSKLDLVYWFFTPLATKAMTKAVLILVFVLVGALLGAKVGPGLVKGYGPVAAQPVPLLVIEILVLGDLIGYWIHRWFHRGRLWKFHAVHHSSVELDWLSSVRLHPVNELMQKVLQFLPFVLLGFPLDVLAGYVPFLTLYALFVHANVDWSFGPLRYVIATPRFHRWHHASESEAIDKNFAGLFPIWDILFATFYMPENKSPRQFGITGEAMPLTLWGQMLYPFK